MVQVTSPFPRWCGECAYELRGLPAAGKCPECGCDFHESQIVLFGWGGPKKATLAAAPPNHMKVHKWVVLLTFFNLALHIATGRWLYSSIWGVQAIITCIWIWRRYHNLEKAPGASQLRVSTSGYGQRDGVGPVVLHPWSVSDRIRVSRAKDGRIRIECFQTTSEDPKQFTDFVIDSTIDPQTWADHFNQILDDTISANTQAIESATRK